ncbi:MAG: SRPBCC family protein [Chloroflexota bacterium]|nr:SRPBCC family protein [Chloroflexota bacterium]
MSRFVLEVSQKAAGGSGQSPHSGKLFFPIPSCAATIPAQTQHRPDVEKVTEEYTVAGRRGRVIWTVREREAPRRWVIAGEVEGGGGGTITYSLTLDAGGTIFERDFVYTMPNALLTLLDRLVLRRRVEAESAEALRRLKDVLERRAT